MNLAATDRNSIKDLLYNFCVMNDIDPNIDALAPIINWLQNDKGNIYLDTFKKQLGNFTNGRYEDMKRPRKLNAWFLGQIIERGFSKFRNHQEHTTEYVKDARQSKKEQLINHAKDNNIDTMKVYGLLVNKPETDRMSFNEIIEML